MEYRRPGGNLVLLRITPTTQGHCIKHLSRPAVTSAACGCTLNLDRQDESLEATKKAFFVIAWLVNYPSAPSQAAPTAFHLDPHRLGWGDYLISEVMVVGWPSGIYEWMAARYSRLPVFQRVCLYVWKWIIFYAWYVGLDSSASMLSAFGHLSALADGRRQQHSAYPGSSRVTRLASFPRHQPQPINKDAD